MPAAALPMARPPRAWLTTAVMLALAMIAYLPAALRAGYLDFDDNFFFGPDNAEFREGLVAVLDPRRTIANVYLPVAHLSLWLDFCCFAEHPFVPHLESAVLHALGAAVFVRFAMLLRVQPLLAHLAGALFVLHPALAESVAWVSSRKDVLAGLFVFAALRETVRFANRPGWWRALWLMMLAALAMYSKATAVVLPLLALLVCFCTGGRRRRFLAPLLLLAVTLPIAWHHQVLAAAEGTLVEQTPVALLAQVPGAFLHYAKTAVWPLHLNVLYPEVQTLERFAAASWLALAPLGGFVAVAIALWRWRALRTIAFGLGAFLVALLPFNTAFPASAIAAADRYLHLAIPGLALAVVLVAHLLLRRVGVALVALALLPMLWLAGARAHEFGDDETLWRASLAADPDNAVAQLNLVHELLQRGPAEAAVIRTHLEAAVASARYPIHELRARQLLVAVALQAADYDSAAAHARAAIAAANAQLLRETTESRRAQARVLVLQTHLGAFEPLRFANDLVAAEASHAAALKIAPEHPLVIAFGALRALEPIALELTAKGAAGSSPLLADDDARGVQADRTLAAALATFPQHPQLLLAQASWDRVRGRVLPAIRNYRKAQAADPECIDAWLGAARLLRERESFTDAEQYARNGLQHRPDPALRQELALALVGQGRLEDAILHLEAYLRVRPQDTETGKVLANVLISRAYLRIGEPGMSHAEVTKIVERALAYNPKEMKAHLVLGRIAREQRRFVDAVEHLETAHRLLPDFPDARQSLAESLHGLGYDHQLKKNDEAAMTAWLRFLEVAPPDMDTQGVKMQLAAIWRRFEARGIERRKAGDAASAIADFRRCLRIDPDQHWTAWLLATTIHDQPGADLDELERLCRQSVAWQLAHELDSSQQTLLLAQTLARREKSAEARQLAVGYLERPDADAKPQVISALRRLADGW